MNTEPCTTCGRFPNRPVTADAIVVRDKRVLLVQRKHDPFAGHFALPGGFVNIDETPEDCAVRELAEETGLIGTARSLLGVYSAVERDPWRHSITFAYLVNVPADFEAEASDDASGIFWAPLDDLPRLAFDHREIVDDLERRLL